MTARMRQELERLLAAWPEDPPRFRALCASVTRGEELVREAGEHGVLGVLQEALADPGSPTLAWKRPLDEQCIVQRLAQSGLVRLLDRALEALALAGIEVVALKGPVLAERLFGDPTVRPSTDIDLLVAPHDLARALEVLSRAGLEQEPGAGEKYFREHHHHLHLHSPDRLVVELHFQLSSNFGAVMPAEEYLARAVEYRTRCGSLCRVLALEDEVLYLAQHAAGHGFTRLAWLYDLKMLLRQNPGLDWSCVRRRAAAAGVLVPLSFTLDVLRRRLGVEAAREGASEVGRFRRRRMARPLLGVMRSLARHGRAAKVAGLLYEASLADGSEAAIRLCRRRLAHWRAR